MIDTSPASTRASKNEERSRRGLKKLADQVVVITGGSTGIGRETAIRFAAAGAKVTILARDEKNLADTVELIRDRGGDAQYIVCDVTDADAVQQAVARVEQVFGRIDTWVGNASALLYASVEDTSPDDLRDLLEVNVVGQVNGIRAALPALRRAGGGALICVSSVEAVVTLPLHSAYAASKRALEGALDGLRRELKAERAPISVTAVRPAVIDTPIYRHARTRMPWKPTAPFPYYQPTVVAQAIVFAATHAVRVIHAGGAGRMLAVSQTVAPAVVDAVLGRIGIRLMQSDVPSDPQPGNLRFPVADDRSGALPHPGRSWSVYTWLRVHPIVRRSAIAAALTLGLLATRPRRSGPAARAVIRLSST